MKEAVVKYSKRLEECARLFFESTESLALSSPQEVVEACFKLRGDFSLKGNILEEITLQWAPKEMISGAYLQAFISLCRGKEAAWALALQGRDLENYLRDQNDSPAHPGEICQTPLNMAQILLWQTLLRERAYKVPLPHTLSGLREAMAFWEDLGDMLAECLPLLEQKLALLNVFIGDESTSFYFQGEESDPAYRAWAEWFFKHYSPHQIKFVAECSPSS